MRVILDFDKNAKIFTKGIPTCNPAKLQNTSTEVAKQQCGSAIIGSGTAKALLPVGSTIYSVNATVTAFNSVPQGGKPAVILHTYSTTPIQTTLVLIGPVTNYNKRGYGPRLDLTVPLIAGGQGALTDFNVKISKKYKYKGTVGQLHLGQMPELEEAQGPRQVHLPGRPELDPDLDPDLQAEAGTEEVEAPAPHLGR